MDFPCGPVVLEELGKSTIGPGNSKCRSSDLGTAWCAKWQADSISHRATQRVPSRDSRARTRSPSPRAWRPDFPGAAREAP